MYGTTLKDHFFIVPNVTCFTVHTCIIPCLPRPTILVWGGGGGKLSINDVIMVFSECHNLDILKLHVIKKMYLFCKIPKFYVITSRVRFGGLWCHFQQPIIIFINVKISYDAQLTMKYYCVNLRFSFSSI